MTREQSVKEALSLLEFHEGSAKPERPLAHPTVRINGEDFARVLALLRAALVPEPVPPPPPPRGKCCDECYDKPNADGVYDCAGCT